MKKILPLLLVLLFAVFAAYAEETVTVRAKDLRGYQENVLTVECSTAGTLTLRVEDDLNMYRVLLDGVQVTAGENTFLWDGLGCNQERLEDGEYRFHAELETAEGVVAACDVPFSLKKCRQALVFALPSGSTIYTDSQWRTEIKLIRQGRLVVEFYEAGAEEPFLTRRKDINNYKIHDYDWDGKVNGKRLPAGDYVLRFFAEENPAYAVDVAVRLVDEKQPAYAIAPTGPIMPTDGMTDADIWALMTAPAVVVDVKATTDYKVLDVPGGRVVGEVHGRSQTLEVLEVRDDGWTKIAAWHHDGGGYMEGYVPTDKLKTVIPNDRYGLLLDKRAQTITVYEAGKPIGTLLVSTGKVFKKDVKRETSAGSFLCYEHMEDFSMNGKNYDYVIRFDGGNLLHQSGWAKVKGKKDYSEHIATLGQKASHGCVRIQPYPNEQGMNAYWIFTHIPPNTRLIVIDDPEERVVQAANAAAQVEHDRALTEVAAPSPLAEGETELTLTLGGDVVLGTREAWQHLSDALPAYLAREGMAYPFRNLLSIFQTDDMTLVNLEGVLKDDGAGEKKEKQYRFRGQTAYTEVLRKAGIDQVNVANNHHEDYGDAGKASTIAALTEAVVPYSGFGHLYVWEQEGHKIGFGGCRETVWRRDKGIIAREVEKLRSVGCDVVIYTCHWGVEYSPVHDSALQQEMAAAAVAAGVDIVVGHHPHVVQGIEHRDGTLILYSLGNLMFGGTHDMTTFDGMLAQVKLRFGSEGYLGASLELIPVLTSSDAPRNNFCPRVADGLDRLRILAKVQADSDIRLAEVMFFPAKQK